jgi:predicted nucleic acid-binding protein
MKRVFIDTNVILDYVLQREHGPQAKAVVAWLLKQQTPMRLQCDILVTLDTKDFTPTVSLKVVTPQEFIEKYISK